MTELIQRLNHTFFATDANGTTVNCVSAETAAEAAAGIERLRSLLDRVPHDAPWHLPQHCLRCEIELASVLKGTP